MLEALLHQNLLEGITWQDRASMLALVSLPLFPNLLEPA